MTPSDALPEPISSLPSPILSTPLGLHQLLASGWLSEARLRDYTCKKRHRLAEVVEAPVHGHVLIVSTNGERFDAEPPATPDTSDWDRMEQAESLRHIKIRDRTQVWSLQSLRAWRDRPSSHSAHAKMTLVCRCGQHVLDLYGVLEDEDRGTARRVVLPKLEHSV